MLPSSATTKKKSNLGLRRALVTLLLAKAGDIFHQMP
jgi:hypothetical protein